MKAKIWTPEPQRPKVVAGVNYKLMLGDSLELLRAMPGNSIDSVVTDGPQMLSSGIRRNAPMLNAIGTAQSLNYGCYLNSSIAASQPRKRRIRG